jgi:acyl transferase domain-containing protein
MQVQNWPESALRRASVNSFGYGGTNAHVILESAIHGSRNGLERPNIKTFNEVLHTNSKLNGASNGIKNGTANNIPTGTANGLMNGHKHVKIRTPKLFVVSAKSQSSLTGVVNKLREWAASQRDNEACMKSLAFTLSSRRSLMQWRSSFVAKTCEDLVSKMIQYRVTKERHDSRIVFLFTGQGAQWFAMGRELIPMQSKFKESLVKSENILKKLGATWSLTEELLRDEQTSLVDRSDISQPLTTALQIALVDLLESIGITPQAVLGHSSGEIAAGYAAGILNHEAALKVSYHRGFTADSCRRAIKSRGAMLAVGMGEVDILKYIAQIKTGIASVACINSPSSTTISGDVSAIDELKSILDSSEHAIFNRKLKVDTAYHSHHMKVVSEDYLKSLEGLKTAEPRAAVKFFSSVTGEEKRSGFGASYWVENMLSQVRYSDALETLCKTQQAGTEAATQHILIELGPHSECISQKHLKYLPSFTTRECPVISEISNRTCCMVGEILT